MNHKTVIKAVKDGKRVEVIVRTRSKKGWYTREESTRDHNDRVDRAVMGVLSSEFHHKNISVK